MQYEIYFGEYGTGFFVDYGQDILIENLITNLKRMWIWEAYRQYGPCWLKLIKD